MADDGRVTAGGVAQAAPALPEIPSIMEHTPLRTVTPAKYRHPRESGDPCRLGPRFRGDDGTQCGDCWPSGVCTMMPEIPA
jgi:hypothetical protein